jgi:hypothetical protein
VIQRRLLRGRSAAWIASGIAGLLLLAAAVEWYRLFPALAFAIQRTPAMMPSSALVPAREIARGVPVLSLYVEPTHLFDPVKGILRHTLAKGIEWERPAFVSYYERGQLLYAAEAGIRVHGGKSREFSPVMSYRLYFRKQYGADEFPRALLFAPSREPLTRFVAHNDLRQDKWGMWWHFVNPLAFDIVRRMGGIAPQTKPAMLYVNGDFQGAYALTEHMIYPGFLRATFGHENFTYGEATHRDGIWRRNRRIPTLSMKVVGREIDLESFTRWYIATVWCAVTDPFQGLMLRDSTRGDARWFLVHWDMDHAFQDLYQQAPKGSPWEHDTFRTLRRERDIRADIVNRLLREDPAYREYFKQRFVEAVNDELTESFLQERFDHYARLTSELRVPHREYLPILQGFLQRRTPAIMKMALPYVRSAGAFRYTVKTTGDGTVQVNGRDVGRVFTGWYFRDMPVRVEALTERSAAFAYWVVNGERVVNAGPALTLPAVRNVAIEAVFRSTT